MHFRKFFAAEFAYCANRYDLLICRLLNYMATIADALSRKVLENYPLPGWELRLPIRPLYWTPELFDWIDNKAELYDPKYAIGPRLLVEHLEQSLCDYKCSVRPPAGDLRRMIPTSDGVWKMHAPGLRIYGWCPATGSFAFVTAAHESETKTDKGLNDQKLKQVREFIKKHSLQNTIIRGDVRAIF